MSGQRNLPSGLGARLLANSRASCAPGSPVTSACPPQRHTPPCGRRKPSAHGPAPRREVVFPERPPESPGDNWSARQSAFHFGKRRETQLKTAVGRPAGGRASGCDPRESDRSVLPPKKLVSDCREHVIQRWGGGGGVQGVGEAGGDR